MKLGVSTPTYGQFLDSTRIAAGKLTNILGKIMKILISLLTVLFLSGCSTIASTYTPSDLLVRTDKSNTPYITDKETIDVPKIASSVKDKEKLNEFIGYAVALSDKKCNEHKALIISNANAWNIGTGTAAILFAGAAAVIDHAKTASDLAAAAAVTAGTQSLVNKQLYADAMGTTILRAIDVSRAKAKAKLVLGLDDNNYTLPRALMDIQEYHDSCSLMAGLVEVTKALDNRKASANELDAQIETIKKQIKALTAVPAAAVPGPTEPSAATQANVELLQTIQVQKMIERADAPN